MTVSRVTYLKAGWPKVCSVERLCLVFAREVLGGLKACSRAVGHAKELLSIAQLVALDLSAGSLGKGCERCRGMGEQLADRYQASTGSVPQWRQCAAMAVVTGGVVGSDRWRAVTSGVQ